MLALTNLSDQVVPVANIQQVIRTRKVNGDKELKFVAVDDQKRPEAFASLNNESKLTFLNDQYVIKNMSEKGVGDTSIKTLEAFSIFTDTMIDCVQYDLFTGSQTFFAALTRVFDPTPYEFSIVGVFGAEQFENFGNENCLSLFEKVLGRYNAEFRFDGNRVTLVERIGEDKGIQFRWGHNVKAIEKSVDSKALSTVIRGYGGKPNDAGVYPVQETHTSPNIAIFGEKHAEPVYSETTSTVPGMRARLEREIIDEPQVSITIDISALGLQNGALNEGDRVPIVYEPMNILIRKARVVQIDEVFKLMESGEWKIVSTAVTLSNIQSNLSDITARFSQTSKRVERLFEGREILPYNVLPEAVRLAAEAINNSMTEIQYPPGEGIVLIDPTNTMNRVRLTSAGIGLSVDGGITYRSALTGAGIVTNELVAGIIRTNNIQIVGENDLFYWNGEGLFAYNPDDLSKYVRLNSSGMYIAGGALTIEREDGYIVMNNGMLQNDFSLQPTVPSFRNEQTVGKQGVYLTTTETTPQVMEAFFFAHKSRYLKLLIVIHDVGTGKGSRLSVTRVGGGGGLLGQAVTYGETDATATPNSITLNIDLGIPTGDRMGIYVNLNTNTGGEARGRIVAIWCDQ